MTSSVSNLVSSTGNLYRCYLWRFYADTDSCQNQALVILIGQIIASAVNFIPKVGGFVGSILSIFLFVCWIMGLIYACQEQEKEVPLIGQIKILK